MELVIMTIILVMLILLFVKVNLMNDDIRVLQKNIDDLDESFYDIKTNQEKIAGNMYDINKNIEKLKELYETITTNVQDNIKITQSKSDVLNNSINTFKSDFETAHTVLMASIKSKSRSTSSQRKAKEQPENCR